MVAVWNELYPWLISGIGGFIGAALLLPTKLGEAVVQFRVGKALEAFKAQQSGELERLKGQLSHVGDRGRRSNEMEFAAIETVWRVFVKAWLSTNTCVGSMTTIPRFDTMTDDEATAFLSGAGLNEGEQSSVLHAADKTRQYTSILDWRRITDAGRDVYQARLTLREQRIFMPAGLTKQFGDVIERMSSVQVERRLSLENPRSQQFGKVSTDWLGDCLAVFEELATHANQRLFRGERQVSEGR
jgi:hypothetical protein